MVEYLHEVTGKSFLCIAGGVGLNSVMNGKVLEHGPFDDVFIQPAASDAGTALGAALVIHSQVLGLCLGLPMGVKLNELFIASYTTENWCFRAIMPWWVHVVTVIVVFGLVGLSSYLSMRRLATMDLAQATKARE